MPSSPSKRPCKCTSSATVTSKRATRNPDPSDAGTGHIVYATEGTLRAVPFDAARLSVTGDPVPVLEGVEHKVSGSVDFSFSDNGSLVYVPGAVSTGGTLGWVTRDGRMTDVIEGAGIFGSPRLRVIQDYGGTPYATEAAREKASL